MLKLRWFNVLRGYPRSSATLPFDRAHTTSYSNLIETKAISYCFRDIIVYFPKIKRGHMTVTMSLSGTIIIIAIVKQQADAHPTAAKCLINY